MKFFIPGKTFLVGEYAVLVGGVAVGLATKPYFEVEIHDEPTDFESSFHPQSPAGLYLTKNPQPLSVQFRDRYQEMDVPGGFGRSTAEYLSVISPDLIKNKVSFFDTLKEYRDLHTHLKVKPSGIDLAFQYFGGVTFADQTLQFYQNFDWNFSDLNFYLVATGLKVATHQHLAELDFKTLESLPITAELVSKYYIENKPTEFLESMRMWVDQLEEKKLTHLNSLHLRKYLEKKEGILLAKPCGALGADVLCVFYRNENADSVRESLEGLKLKVLASSNELAEGYVSQIRHFWSDHVDRSLSPL